MDIKAYTGYRKKNNTLRLVVLLAVLAVLTAFGIAHQVSDGIRPAGVDALCPFGGVESLITVLSAGKFLERVALSSFVLLAATVITALLFRRSFCGNLCPLGTLQELSARLGKKIFGKRYIVPAGIDRPARYLKYVILVVVVVFSAVLGDLVFRPYDPWVVWQHLTSVELFSEFLYGLVILVLTLGASLLYDRVFCKYLCPLGAFVAVTGQAGYFRIKRNAETCIDCGACDRVCPVNLPVATSMEIKSAECLNCNLCVDACPVQNTLTIEGKKKGRISSRLVLAATVGIFAVTVLVASFAGGTEWTIKGIEERAMAAGVFNPAEIKGSDLFSDVARLSAIPKEAFIEKFKLSEAEYAGKLRDWAHKPGSTFEVEDVRAFVTEKMKK
jgi:ferredoxin